MSREPASSALELPADTTLPLFVYGALKPGMPAFNGLGHFVQYPPEVDQVIGELFVRDGLPLLFLSGHGTVEGFVLRWQPGKEQNAYRAVCDFEPRKHYEWQVVSSCANGARANALCVRYPSKGNPQPLFSSEWKLTDDPAFGEGLTAVQDVIREIEDHHEWNDWQRFFRAQMAYLLLWSILERLSAFCFGPGHDPMRRVKQLHELKGMPQLVKKHVNRTDTVSDSRNPDASYKLDASNPKKCFDYYYQVRSNLSHRGKAVHNEVDKVTKSLAELFAIIEGYLWSLRDFEQQR